MADSNSPSGGSSSSSSRKRPHDDGPPQDSGKDSGSSSDPPRRDNEDEDEDEVLRIDDLFGDEEALYGASTDNECTYNKGYLARQPVYACRTCQTDGPAVICYGCARRCHDGHELLELYSKRNLCCDCGNAKFASVVADAATGEKFTCQLCEFKTLNRDNKYNQNFGGLYCVCSRPYPDPDNPSGEEMLQCVVCEDWYHSNHLAWPDWCCETAAATAAPPASASVSPDSYEELVCQLCAERLPYLRRYALTGSSDGKSAGMLKGPSNTSREMSSNKKGVSDISNGSSGVVNESSDISMNKSSQIANRSPDVTKGSSDIANGSSDIVAQPLGCAFLLDSSSAPQQLLSSGPLSALLMPSGWRLRLCRCASCLAAYASDGVTFLTDPADSLAEFEQANRRAAEEQSRPENVLRSLATAGVPHASVQLVAGAIGDLRRGLARAMSCVLAEKNCGGGGGENEPAVITRADADRILAMMAPMLAKRARFQPPENCRKE